MSDSSVDILTRTFLFPQTLEWIFGFNSDVPLINLTTDPSMRTFASASAHVFQIFRSDGNKMQSFVGHVSAVKFFEFLKHFITQILPLVCHFGCYCRHLGESHIFVRNRCNRSLYCVGWQKWNHKHLGYFNRKVICLVHILWRFFIVCVVFRSEFPHPIRTIFEPYNRQHPRRLSKVALSGDGKNIITASDGKGSLIKLWQWSFGTTPDGDKPSGKDLNF